MLVNAKTMMAAIGLSLAFVANESGNVVSSRAAIANESPIRWHDVGNGVWDVLIDQCVLRFDYQDIEFVFDIDPVSRSADAWADGLPIFVVEPGVVYGTGAIVLVGEVQGRGHVSFVLDVGWDGKFLIDCSAEGSDPERVILSRDGQLLLARICTCVGFPGICGASQCDRVDPCPGGGGEPKCQWVD